MASKHVVMVVVVLLCLFSLVESQRKKKKAPKKRVATIVKELEKNVSALWSKVDMLSQPVHVHLHGDSHLMDDDHHHHHHHHPCPSHDNHNRSSEQDGEENASPAPLVAEKAPVRAPRGVQADAQPMMGRDHRRRGQRGGHGDRKQGQGDDRQGRQHGMRGHKHQHHDDDHDQGHGYMHGPHGRGHMHGPHGRGHMHGPHGRGHMHGPHGRGHMHGPDHGHHDHGHHDHHQQHHPEGDKHDDDLHDHHDHHDHHDCHHHDEEEEEHHHHHDDHDDMPHGTHVHIHLHTGDMAHMRPPHHDVPPALPKEYVHAVCDVVASADILSARDIRGSILMRQMPAEPLEMKVALQGFPIDMRQDPSVRYLRGMHGHQFGDVSDSCTRQGGHYNPHNIPHGGPEAEHQHPGDFGNLVLESDGSVTSAINNSQASLFGPFSLLGRGIVIHAGADDLGLKEDEASKRSGNAGPRIACCAIVASPEPAAGVWP